MGLSKPYSRAAVTRPFVGCANEKFIRSPSIPIWASCQFITTCTGRQPSCNMEVDCILCRPFIDDTKQNTPAIGGVSEVRVCRRQSSHLDDAVNRAACHTLRRVKMSHTFHAGARIDHITGITLTDRLSMARWRARTAGNALVGDFHSHGRLSSGNLWF